MRFTGSRGFTLIEVLIVVAILGIIAAIAYPSYTEQVRKTRRADAQTCLAQAAGIQERIYAETLPNSYGTNAELSRLSCNPDGVSSKDGHYSLSVDNSNPGPGCSANRPFNCFTITATAVGTQLQDTQCLTFTINHLGQRTSAPNTTDCWAD